MGWESMCIGDPSGSAALKNLGHIWCSSNDSVFKSHILQNESQTVWPAYAFLKGIGDKISYKSCPNI